MERPIQFLQPYPTLRSKRAIRQLPGQRLLVVWLWFGFGPSQSGLPVQGQWLLVCPVWVGSLPASTGEEAAVQLLRVSLTVVVAFVSGSRFLVCLVVVVVFFGFWSRLGWSWLWLGVRSRREQQLDVGWLLVQGCCCLLSSLFDSLFVVCRVE